VVQNYVPVVKAVGIAAELFFDLGSVRRSCHSLTVRYYSVWYYQINTHLGTVHGSVRMSLPRHSVWPHGPLNRGCLTRFSVFGLRRTTNNPPYCSTLYLVGKEGLLATSYRVQYVEGWYRDTKGRTVIVIGGLKSMGLTKNTYCVVQ